VSGPGRVSLVARALGFAGLLPQVGALAGVIWGGPDWIAYAIAVAVAYGALILSFLGGIWWGLAVRRAEEQGALAARAIAPSLIALFVIIGMFLSGKYGTPSEDYYLWGCLALGMALAATLIVDVRLERSGEVPPGWTRFRAILSGGLALLTASAGVAYAVLVRSETFY
jgi:hypothetical protein